jgi:D-3-phosphoglycerate dehydrogenase
MAHQVAHLIPTPADQQALILGEQPAGYETRWIDRDDPEALRAALAAADFIITERLSAEQVELVERARLIQMPGVGYELIDVAAAARRGVPVAITPEGTCVGVSEHTILMILALYKHLTEAHNGLHSGQWLHPQLRSKCLMLEGKRVGLVGLGRIGVEVAKRLRAFGVELVYTDVRRRAPDEEAALGVRYLPFDELLRTSDVVTLHTFLSAETRHMIGERELGLMKPTAILINTSRGGVVDEAALYRCLAERRIAGAGVDVFETEPTPAENPLLKLDNVLLTPHMATANRDAIVQKARACYQNFERVVRGEAPINVVRAG